MSAFPGRHFRAFLFGMPAFVCDDRDLQGATSQDCLVFMLAMQSLLM